MIDSNKILLAEIMAFLKQSGMADTMFGLRAAGNPHVVGRLQSGRSVTLTTADRIRAYIADWGRIDELERINARLDAVESRLSAVEFQQGNEPVSSLQLLVEIEAFLDRTGTAATTFGLRSVNDGKLVDRLRAGGNVTLPTADRIRVSMATWEDAAGPG